MEGRQHAIPESTSTSRKKHDPRHPRISRASSLLPSPSQVQHHLSSPSRSQDTEFFTPQLLRPAFGSVNSSHSGINHKPVIDPTMPYSVQSPRLPKRKRGRSPPGSAGGGPGKPDSDPVPLIEAQVPRIQNLAAYQIPVAIVAPMSIPAPASAVPPRKRSDTTPSLTESNVEGRTMEMGDRDIEHEGLPEEENPEETLPVARSLFGYPNTAVLRQKLVTSWEASTVLFRERWNFDPETGTPCDDPHHCHRYVWTKILPQIDNGGKPIVPASPRRQPSSKLSSFQQAANQSSHRPAADMAGCQTPPTTKKFNGSPLTQRSIKDYMRTKKGTSSHCDTKKKSAN